MTLGQPEWLTWVDRWSHIVVPVDQTSGPVASWATLMRRLLAEVDDLSVQDEHHVRQMLDIALTNLASDDSDD